MNKYYHATSYDNLNGILCDGLKTSMEGIVYMTLQSIPVGNLVHLIATY